MKDAFDASNFKPGDIVRVKHTDHYGVVLKIGKDSYYKIYAIICNETFLDVSWWPAFPLEVVLSRTLT